jgi:cytochrome c5
LSRNKTAARSGRRVFTCRAAVFVAPMTAVWNLQDPRAATVGTFGSNQEPDAQEHDERTKGMEAMGQACVQCHGLRPVRLQRKTADQWLNTVQGMIGRGAQVMPDEIEPIVSYLAATFGPQSPPQGGRAGQTEDRSPVLPMSAGMLPEGSGRNVLMERCLTCHPVEVTTRPRQSKEQWLETIRKMRTLGATIPADEEEVFTEYLARHFGPRSQ